MTYVHRKLQFPPDPFEIKPRSKNPSTRRARRVDALAAAKEKGELPAYQAFIELCGATSDIVLWLEVEEPELAESMPIRHTGFLKSDRILTDGPSVIYQAYEAAFRSDTARARWAAQRKAALDHQWQLLSEYPAHWWLSQQSGWTSVFGALERKASQASGVSYRHGLARFRLLEVISREVGAYLWRKCERWEPDVVSNADIRKALGHVKALMNVLTPGVQLISPMEIGMLGAYLGIVEAILEDGPKLDIPKNRRDKTLLERHFVAAVIAGLNRAFGEASPTLVGHIASIAGYVMPETTLRRVRARSRTKQK